MTLKFGNGVSRTLTPEQRNFVNVVFQRGKPPCDADLNFSQQIISEQTSMSLRGLMPSGFLTDPLRSMDDYVTAKNLSNMFRLGSKTTESTPVIWAFVNGWVVPVAGTSNTDGVTNDVKLFPPPSSGTRTDFVFLEVWQSLVSPNPSVVNKPLLNKIWKYGNTEFGGTNIDDDLIDGTIGREVTKRVQIQYRIRVVGSGLGSGVSLSTYPDGMDDPLVLGQGGSTTPVGGLVFTNMGDELGDPSLWRAGDGNSNNALNTCDGYVYAIPICAVFRRNTSTFTIFSVGASNNSGGFDRNPSAAYLASPRTGAKEFTTPTVSGDIAYDYVGDINVSDLTGSGLDDPYFIALTHKFVKIGTENIKISAVDAALGTITISERGRGNSWPSAIPDTQAVEFFNHRPDGLFADEIAFQDILDLRRSVTPGDWDYDSILHHNLMSLLTGEMKTTWKKSGTGDTQGPTVIEVDLLHADGGTAPPPDVEVLDGPDGIRTIWSDSIVIQSDVSVLCDPSVSLLNKSTTGTFDAAFWDVGADFKPYGFMNYTGATQEWSNGSMVFLNIGGSSGADGARATFRDGITKGVRFVSPTELWKDSFPTNETGDQTPVKILFQGNESFYNVKYDVSETSSSGEFGPYYPLKDSDFTRPFCFLGGLLNPLLKFDVESDGGPGTITLVTSLLNGTMQIDLQMDFDTAGTWFTNVAFNSARWPDLDRWDSPERVTNPVLNGTRTLRDMITNGGKDVTGQSSEVYVILWGDYTNPENNGLFRVTAAGTTALMGGCYGKMLVPNTVADNSTSIVVQPMTVNHGGAWVHDPTQVLKCEFRSQYTTMVDGVGGYVAQDASAVVVFTDIKCETPTTENSYPWRWVTNYGGPDGIIRDVFNVKMEIKTSLMYDSGRSGFARVPGHVDTVGIVAPSVNILKRDETSIDPLVSQMGTISNMALYNYTEPSLWNRIQCKGMDEQTHYWCPRFSEYGGVILDPISGWSEFLKYRRMDKCGGYMVGSEQDRENEILIDEGSKTIVVRPFQNKLMTLSSLTYFTEISPVGLMGTFTVSGVPKDGAGIFTPGQRKGYPVPSQFMPKFGRQDIPYFKSTAAGTFLDGINHLFTDTEDPTNPVFNVIGGEDNSTGGNAVFPMYLQTGASSGYDYGEWGVVTGAVQGYQARLTTDIGTSTDEKLALTRKLEGISSSDVGVGLKGIQLPPYIGIARLYGVYERADFAARNPAFLPDRITASPNPPTNLLRKDAHKQSLYILQDGAEDYTLEKGDHTYIIPSTIIDHTRYPGYVPGVLFENLEYVVEMTIFGFSKYWINYNNMVLARLHTGDGTLIGDGINMGNITTEEMAGFGMVIPSALPYGSKVCIAYNRTPYQGDPYMTRNGDTMVLNDYMNSYGRLDTPSAFGLSESIQQQDVNGTVLVETPNKRSFEVLKSMDFYTTMGTGKVGGKMYPGTIMDCGFTDISEENSTRIPGSITSSDYQPNCRTFTEGQKKNETTASLEVSFILAGGLPEDYEIIYFHSHANSGLSQEFVGVAAPMVPADYIFSGITNVAIAESFLEDCVNGLSRDPRGLYYNTITGSCSGTKVTIRSEQPGAIGNQIAMSIYNAGTEYVQLNGGINKVYLSGGVDLINNAGDGSSVKKLTGMTERLPLGILLRDSDFLSEDILNNGSSSFMARSTISSNVQKSVLTRNHDQLLDGVGALITMSDGSILEYTAYDSVTHPAGTKKFRLYRGGGAAFILSGVNPGGPVEWVSSSIPAQQNPVLKGGVLAGKAFLVRNFNEEAFAVPKTVSYGDELQMVVLTYGILGDGNEQKNGLDISGTISPTGYGEGYAASDRYRLEAKPMFKGRNKDIPDHDSVTLAKYYRS